MWPKAALILCAVLAVAVLFLTIYVITLSFQVRRYRALSRRTGIAPSYKVQGVAKTGVTLSEPLDEGAYVIDTVDSTVLTRDGQKVTGQQSEVVRGVVQGWSLYSVWQFSDNNADFNQASLQQLDVVFIDWLRSRIAVLSQGQGIVAGHLMPLEQEKVASIGLEAPVYEADLRFGDPDDMTLPSVMVLRVVPGQSAHQGSLTVYPGDPSRELQYMLRPLTLTDVRTLLQSDLQVASQISANLQTFAPPITTT